MSSSALASRVRILSTTLSGALRQERLVAELGLRLGLLLLRRREVLGEALALGGDVDRAGQVERDRGAGDGERGGGV